METKLKKYPAYKDSGIEWLGEIPEHWEVRKLKYICENVWTGTTPPTSNDKFFDGNLNWYTPSDLNEENLIFSERKISNHAINKGVIKLFPGDSILIVGIGATSGKTSYLIKKAAFNQQITGFHSKMNFNKFIFYCLKNQSNIFLRTANYTTLPILNNEYFKNYLLPIPPLSEQIQIAEYLDKKTALLDKAIKQKEQIINLLKERKQILINRAVTRGLDPNVKMKDSDIDWIGEIPEHWEVRKLKYLGFLYSGLNGKKGDDFILKQFDKHIKPFIPFTNISNNSRIVEGQYNYVKINENEEQNKVINGDILLLMTSETLDDIGKSSLYTGKEDELYLNSFCKGLRLTSKNIIPNYLNYQLLTDSYRKYFSLKGRGFTRINLKQEFIKDVSIIIPPIPEQQQISQYIEHHTTKIDKAITLQQEEIEKLKEYRSVLIDNVVRGKVRVTE